MAKKTCIIQFTELISDIHSFADSISRNKYWFSKL